MKKTIICNECNKISTTDYYCDNCGLDLIGKCLGVPITIEFGFSHPCDCETYHFCSNKCVINFLTAEEAKKNPRNDIIFGEEK